MSTLTDSDIKEKPRVIAVSTLTLAVIAGTYFGLDALGLAWVWYRIHQLPFHLGLAASIALWGSVLFTLLKVPIFAALFLTGVARLCLAFPSAAGQAAKRAIRTLGRAARLTYAFAVIITAPVVSMFGPVLAGIWLIVRPLLPVLEPVLYALHRLWSVTGQPLVEKALIVWFVLIVPSIEFLNRLWNRASLEWTLLRAYRREFRGAFKSYRELRKAFDESSVNDDAQTPPAPDLFVAACRALGLPESGKFTKREFKTQYRSLLKEVHPDIAGPNKRAAEINAAIDIIKERKGWS